MSTNGPPTNDNHQQPLKSLASFMKSRRSTIQAVALLLAIVMPFILYEALQNGDDMLAIASFALITLSMLLVILA